MLAVLLALAAAAGFGGSDFAAGIAARGASVIRVTILSEATAATLGLLIVPWISDRGLSAASAAWGAGAGVSGVAGAMTLYLGFRHAAFSVASSLSAVGSAALSVLAGLLLGERPAALSLAGIALAVPAIVAVSAGPGEARPGDGPAATTGRHLAGVGYGLVAGACFALYFICLSRAGSGNDLWPVAVAQVMALVVVVAAGTVTGQLGRLPARASLLAVATGAGGMAGTAFFFLATHTGLLSVTAVITSLYPAVTILLARVMLGERLTPLRLAGLCLAAASVTLIAAG